MTTPNADTVSELVRLLDAAAPYDLVDVCARWLRMRMGARWTVLLLVDYAQAVLEPVPGATPGRRYAVREDTVGRAYREQRIVSGQLQADAERTLCVPVTIRSERLGVLLVGLPEEPAPEVGDTLLGIGTILAHLISSARRYTDCFEVLRRRKDLGLAAEIQWELLPVLAYELPAFSIAGALEPTYEIGGDTFDYAANATRLNISVTDAVGHGLRAALLGNLAVTAMRNVRRGGGGLLDQAEWANHHLCEQFPGSSFVTGQLLEIDLDGGGMTIVNAGHPPPLLLRGGVASTLELAPDLPLGLYPTTRYRPQHRRLEPGDRLLLITDGISEAHVRGRSAFGTERVAQLLTGQAHLPPAEFVQLLTEHVLRFRGGDLADDATAVCLDWR